MTRMSLVLLLGLMGGLSAAARPEASAAVQAQGGDTGAARGEYVGDAACASCHKEQGLAYLHTSHFLTSRLVDKDSVLG